MAMKEEVSAVEHNEFWVSEVDELNVEDTEDCAKDGEKEENSEIEIAENNFSCGERGEKLCLSNLIDKEDESNKGFVLKLSPEILIKGYTVFAAVGGDKIAERMESSNYLFNSIKHKLNMDIFASAPLSTKIKSVEMCDESNNESVPGDNVDSNVRMYL